MNKLRVNYSLRELCDCPGSFSFGISGMEEAVHPLLDSWPMINFLLRWDSFMPIVT